jgi:hypothetical protein
MLKGKPWQRDGLCSRCGKTTVHAHMATGLGWWFHHLTGQVLPRLGLGRWSCEKCYRQRWWLSPWFRRDAETGGASGFEADGNFLLNDYSLVRRSLRSSRYTRKFRDSIVERLLSGQVRMDTVRSELRVRENDILAWIADRMHRQQERINQLTSMLELLARRPGTGHLEQSSIVVENVAAGDPSENDEIQVARD